MDCELVDGKWVVVYASLYKDWHGKVAFAVSDRRTSFEVLLLLTKNEIQ